MSIRNPHRIAAALVCALLAQGAAAADSSPFHLSLGTDYSSGKYGQSTRTTIWSVPLAASYDTDNWSFKLSVPWLRVSGPSNVIPGIGPVQNTNPFARGLDTFFGLIGITPPGSTPPPAPTQPRIVNATTSGIGDVSARATYHLVNDSASQLLVDVSGNVQFGTASADKGLGTGQNNYGAELDVYKGLSSDWTLFGGIGYTKLGSSQYIRLQNVWSANAGVNYALSADDSIGVAGYYQQRASSYGYAQRSATLYYSHKLAAAWTLQGYLLGGFSDGSPDYGAGITLKYGF